VAYLPELDGRPALVDPELIGTLYDAALDGVPVMLEWSRDADGAGYTQQSDKIGIEQGVAHWASAGDATITVTLRESIDGVNEDSNQSLGTAGAQGPAAPTVVRVRTPFVKLRAAVSVANATTLRGSLKAT
jgi:hypothetical protein